MLGRVEHVAVVGQGVRAAHRRLPDAQQVLAGGRRQRSVPAAQLSLRERGSEGAARPCRQSSAQRRERQPLQPCGTMGMHMAGMHGWHKWSYWEAKPLLRTVGKLPHGMDHRNRGSDTAGVNHDYFGGVKKASCLKAGSSHMLCMTFIFCNNHKAASPLCALISKPGFYKGEQLPLLAKKKINKAKPHQKQFEENVLYSGCQHHLIGCLLTHWITKPILLKGKCKPTASGLKPSSN